MKKLAFTLLTLTFMVPFCFGEVNDIHSLRLHWEHYTLTNGLQVVLQPDRSRNDVAIEFWLHVGVKDEPHDKAGLAHFFEHATPYGLRNRPDDMRLLRDNMNFSNAQTRMDYTRYFFQINPHVFELGLQYVADRLSTDTTAITDEIVEKHRTNVLAEFDRQTSHPFWGGKQRALRQAGTFGETHPYGHSAYGTRQNNESFTTQDIREWYDKYVFAGNTTLFIVGNFDVEETKRLIEKYFANIHQKPALDTGRNISACPTPKKVTVEIPSEYQTIILSWAAPEWASEEAAALRLLSHIADRKLGDVHRPEAIDESGAALFLYQMAGEFIVYADFSSIADSILVENWLRKTVRGVIEKGVSEAELQEAQQQELKSVRNKIENEQLGFMGSRIELLGEGLLFAGNPDSYISRLQKQQELTNGDLQSITKKWLAKKPFCLLTVASKTEL